MATTTTNYGWDIPQSTDLVKDGATAIATLGQDIDTSIYTALGGNKSGLVLLNTTSFSGVATISVPANSFSATYDNYLINFVSTGSTSSTFYMRLRAAGVDSATAIYHWAAGRFRSDGVASNTNNNADTGFAFAYSEQAFAASMFLLTPYLLQKTLLVAPAASGTSGNLSYSGTYSGLHENTTTAYDSCTFYNANAANMTGSVSVYGFNK